MTKGSASAFSKVLLQLFFTVQVYCCSCCSSSCSCCCCSLSGPSERPHMQEGTVTTSAVALGSALEINQPTHQSIQKPSNELSRRSSNQETKQAAIHKRPSKEGTIHTSKQLTSEPAIQPSNQSTNQTSKQRVSQSTN